MKICYFYSYLKNVNVLLDGQGIAEQKFWVRLAKGGLALKWVRRDVDGHQSAVQDDVVCRDVAKNQRSFSCAVKMQSALSFRFPTNIFFNDVLTICWLVFWKRERERNSWINKNKQGSLNEEKAQYI
jgi:hypothetical protein